MPSAYYHLQPHPSHTLQHASTTHPTYSDIETHPPLHQSHAQLLRHHSMSQPSPSSYDMGYPQPSQPSVAAGRKRSRPEEHLQQLDLPNPLAQQQEPYGQPTGPSIQVGPSSQSYPLQPYPQPSTPQHPLPHHHHHHFPDHRPSKRLQMEGQTSPGPSHGPPNVVGHDGMPAPAPRPRGPKLKFTPEDDQLLVDLKEKKNLAWKQIADFFPGRSSGTLQVRYCTKLKAKTTVWTDEMVQKLRNSMQEYENDRWRIIASKVGSGFSPGACREKAEEIAAVEAEEEEDEQSGYAQSQVVGAPGSSDQGPSFPSSDPNPNQSYQ
ncbi:unnamed protein product [Periconia digitata]|uniref:Myb-like domain-containing protein n=1 Tax=Periconia digitata TaxID=1303443 RepID=A0A9W4XVL9_9PLEO|nr:unnamed protein product [Periconia digitata]